MFPPTKFILKFPSSLLLALALLLGFCAISTRATAAETETWYVYGKAYLSDSKTVYFTPLFPITIELSSPYLSTADANIACQRLAARLKNHLESSLELKVMTSAGFYAIKRSEGEQRRDNDMTLERSKGKRTPETTTFSFSYDSRDK